MIDPVTVKETVCLIFELHSFVVIYTWFVSKQTASQPFVNKITQPLFIFLIWTRTDAAFGGWCEACGAKLASLAFEGASPPFCGPCGKKFPTKKIWIRKFFEHRNLEKNREIFFFDFPKFFSVEIFHMMSGLRMQNITIIGQGVPEIRGVTDRLKLRIYCKKKIVKLSDRVFSLYPFYMK